jgi:hypothetical protein
LSRLILRIWRLGDSQRESGVYFVLANLLGLVFLVVVSEIMLYFKLENIKSDQDLLMIMNRIKHSLRSVQDPSDKILVFKIQDVSGNDSTMIPKIEYKKSD